MLTVNYFDPNHSTGNSSYKMSIPRPQYQNLSGRKRVTPNRMAPQIMSTMPPPSSSSSSSSLSQHDDIIKFIFESWMKVNREYSEQSYSESGRNPIVTYYQEKEPNPLLKDFEPFDLEAWWGQRLVQNFQAATSTSTS